MKTAVGTTCPGEFTRAFPEVCSQHPDSAIPAVCMSCRSQRSVWRSPERQQRLPFDTAVGAALVRLHQARPSKLDPEKDRVVYSRLMRKQALLPDRIKRYGKPLPEGDGQGT